MQQPVIPAWKRLGLKLKYADEVFEPTGKLNGDGGVITSPKSVKPNSRKEAQQVSDEPPRKKRKASTGSDEVGQARLTNGADTSNGKPSEVDKKKLKKRVSFSADVKLDTEMSGRTTPVEAEDSPAGVPATKRKKEKTKKGRAASNAQQPSNPALEYLSQYHTARSTWKFNKNREIWILKHALSEADIPKSYDVALARYVHGLKGAGARDRLKTACVDMLKKQSSKEYTSDQLNDGHEGLQDGRFQARFENELQELQELQDAAKADQDNGEFQTWIQHQPRSKLLLWSLGHDGSLPTEAKENTTTAQTNGTDSSKLRQKKKKNRTAVVEYESSSSSSSSESDTDDESDSDHDASPEAAEETTSSSGSDSSTSSESSSDSDSE
ncbi:hypothetical protein LTR72_007312 [Exophiala xenobiotica]|nr:hypothetical protein LTR92_007496 [Exophiala xenobiotica]KAK5220690.1 hypothetical protein LTR72_007312 [Exophiala xenobiotica]KAK5290962.1 hypothetical protein LTR14_006469 [Exophiala xenobiotica]KAK5377339.1 hypothetical protein LTS13_004209 [Exophiala xenobiotica]KAK5393348.1 hypothetical protein LTR79_009016 [Exophiala xenobiotica]